LLRERADVPLARGGVPAGTAPVVAVAALPRHPSNAVLLLTRRGGAPAEITRVPPEPIEPPGPEQWFRAALPAPEEGRSLDYRVELVRAGQRLATLPADGSWLTVTGGPPQSAPPAPVPSSPDAPSLGPGPRWDHELRFFATLTITGRLEVIGETPDGYRVNFLVERGTLTGPDVDGVVHPGGGDWMRVRTDGVASLEIRATAETSDGAVIFYRAGGVLDLGPGGYAQIALGRLSGCPPFYATPTFVTAHSQWRWLNRVQGFGIGRALMEERRVEYDIYLPQVGDRRRSG
jgi:hypothetical protein